MASAQGFKWSPSRSRMLEECPRRYFYQYYLKSPDPRGDPERWTTYRLSKMTSIPLEVGDAVHKAIVHDQKIWKVHSAEESLERSIARAQNQVRHVVFETREEQWKRDPKQHKCLLELYYEWPDVDDLVAEAMDQIRICLTNFRESRSWQQMRESKLAHWLKVSSDYFAEPAICILDIPCFMQLDFCCAHGDYCTIIDWKTGHPRKHDDEQVLFYALYVQAAAGYEARRSRLRLVYLREGDQKEISVSEDGLNIARAHLCASNEQMMLMQAAGETLDVEEFHSRPQRSRCRYCSFQEICRPDFNGGPDATAGAEDDASDVY